MDLPKTVEINHWEKKNPKIKQSAEYNMNFLPNSKEKLASSFDNTIKSV